MPSKVKRAIYLTIFALVAVWMYRNSTQMGFSYDINTFWAWAIRLRDVGFGSFYSAGYFADYLPTYLYILSLMSRLAESLSIAHDSAAGIRWIKIPAMFAHLILAWMVVKNWAHWNRRDDKVFKLGGILSLLYLISPAHLYNSAIYGQVDTIFCLGTSLMIWTLIERKPILSGIMVALMIGFKPQTVFIIPLYALLMIRTGWQLRSKPMISHFLSAFTGLVILILPFWHSNPLGAIQHYRSNFASYPYYSVNAMNLYALLGMNWVDMTQVQVFGLFSGMEILVYAGILLSCLLLYWAGGLRRIRNLDEESSLLIGAAFVSAVFFFAPQMHERYLFPLMGIMPFLFLRSRELFFAFFIASLTICLNQIQSMDQFFGSKAGMTGPVALFGAIGNLVVLILILKRLRRCLLLSSSQETSPDPSETQEHSRTASILIYIRERLPPTTALDRRHWLGLSLAGIALLSWNLFDLGASRLPTTGIAGNANYQIYLRPGTSVQRIHYFRLAAEGEAIFRCGDDGESIRSSITYADFATWGSVHFSVPCAKTIHVVQQLKILHLIPEIILYSEAENIVRPFQICDSQGCIDAEESSLFDEAAQYQSVSRKAGTYFDEIYYARAAFELADRTPPFESTHPPLGKLLIAASTSAFGFAPFQWRLPGAVASALIPLLVFVLAHTLGGNLRTSILASMLSTLDFTRIVLGRIATLDTQVTAWMLLAFVFTSRFIIDRVQASSLLANHLPLKHKDWRSLYFAGISIGLALATKWNALFALIALSMLLLGWLILDFYDRAIKSRNHLKLRLSRQILWQNATRLATCLFVVPFAVYYLVFVCEAIVLNQSIDPLAFLNRQLSMLSYHSGLTATHPFASAFFSWPFIQVPVYLWTQDLGSGMRATLAVIGNPAIWWAIIPSLLYLMWNRTILLSPIAGVALTAFLALFFSWAGASRIVFIYHFYAASCFACILLALAVEDLSKRAKWVDYAAVGIAALLAYKFWPVYMGTPTSTATIEKGLRWFSTWVF